MAAWPLGIRWTSALGRAKFGVKTKAERQTVLSGSISCPFEKTGFHGLICESFVEGECQVCRTEALITASSLVARLLDDEGGI